MTNNTTRYKETQAKDLKYGHRSRLRQRFLKSGLEGFHDYEALELLLTYAIERRDVKPLAKKVIEHFGSLKAVLDAPPDELRKVAGVGEFTSVLIALTKGLIGEYLKEGMHSKDVVSCSEDIVRYLKAKLSGEKAEKFVAVYLNTKNEVIADEVLHEGTINQTIVYPRKAIEFALKHNARSIIFVHNHPSGDPTPSKQDRELTNDLVSAAKTMDILVHDHIIIGRDSHFSGQENGWFKR